MAPKKVKESGPPTRFQILNYIIQFIGPFIFQLICSFYLLVVRYTGEGIHAVLEVLFRMIRDVIKILLVLVARVVSEICFGAALVVEKILEAILHLLLLLVLKGGSFINQTLRGLVNEAGYALSSAVFITITLLIWWFIVPLLEDTGHAILHLFD